MQWSIIFVERFYPSRTKIGLRSCRRPVWLYCHLPHMVRHNINDQTHATSGTSSQHGWHWPRQMMTKGVFCAIGQMGGHSMLCDVTSLKEYQLHVLWVFGYSLGLRVIVGCQPRTSPNLSLQENKNLLEHCRCLRSWSFADRSFNVSLVPKCGSTAKKSYQGMIPTKHRKMLTKLEFSELIIDIPHFVWHVLKSSHIPCPLRNSLCSPMISPRV